MGNGQSMFKKKGPKFVDLKTLRETNQQISIANNYSFERSTRKIALIACNESLSYCDSLIDFLFKFHLSQRTLHHYILRQLRYMIQITKILNSELETAIANINGSNSNSNIKYLNLNLNH